MSNVRIAGVSLPIIVFAAALLGLFLFLAVPRIVASSSPSDGVIHSCVNASSGEIKIVDEGDSCKKNGVALAWNAQGIQGEQGIQGIKGDQGIQGIQGIKGDKGDQGIQGIKGIKGDKGDKGDTGSQAAQYPVSVAMDQSKFGRITLSNITVNGRQITGPVAPNTPVTFKFDFAIISAPGPIVSLTVGFAGESANRCVHLRVGNHTGVRTVTLNTPATVGPAVFAARVGLDFNCTPGHPNTHYHPEPGVNAQGAFPISANTAFSTYLAVVAVK